MTRDALIEAYEGYIACLNARDWERLPRFVAPEVARNGVPLGLAGYRGMLEGDVAAIPDLRFTIARLACDPPLVAAGLVFDCTPRGELFGLPVNGRRVRFEETVVYRFHDGRIREVWSVIDQAAVAAQL